MFPKPSRVDEAKDKKAAAEKRRYARRKPKACAHCGTEYLPPYSAKAAGSNKFCSRKCYFATVGARPAMTTATCTQCKATFKRTAAALKRVRHSFCGSACRALYFRGENSPMFRGDKDPNRGAGWNRLADSIRERDSFTCRRCGRGECGTVRKEKLSVDHVRPWRSFEDKALANHQDNLVSLCRRCHSYKTTVVERAWLLGDVLAWRQWVQSLHLPSAVSGWIVGAAKAPVSVPPPISNGNTAKTHCLRGHEFTEENTRVRYGRRECLACVRIRSLVAWKRRKDDKDGQEFTVREEIAVRVVRKD